MKCPNDLLPTGIVIHRFSGFHHGPGQCGFGDDHARPDSILKLGFINCTVTVLQQENQEIKHAWLNLHDLSVLPQLALCGVDFKFAEPAYSSSLPLLLTEVGKAPAVVTKRLHE